MLNGEGCVRWRGSCWIERIVLDGGDYVGWVISITKPMLARYMSLACCHAKTNQPQILRIPSHLYPNRYR